MIGVDFLKFIFPQNYNFKSKFLGIIEYNILVLNIIWSTFILCLLNFIFSNLNIKIILFIILCFPILLFSIFGFNHENIISIFIYISRYISKPKLYLYCKKRRKMI